MKPSSAPPPKTDGKWRNIAKAALDLFPENVPQGQIQSEWTSVSEKLGIQRQTLRNYVAAYKFAASVQSEEPKVADMLWNCAPAAIDVYNRWAKFDRKGAFRHLAKYVSTDMSVAKVMEAERDARDANNKQTGRSISLTDQLLAVEKALVSLSGHDRYLPQPFSVPIYQLYQRVFLQDFHWNPPKRESFEAWCGITRIGTVPRDGNEDLYFDLDFTPIANRNAWKTDRPEVDVPKLGDESTSNLLQIGVIEVSDYTIPEHFRREAKSLIARAALATSIYPVVIILAPNKEGFERICSASPNLNSKWMADAQAQRDHWTNPMAEPDLPELSYVAPFRRAQSRPFIPGLEGEIQICWPGNFHALWYQAALDRFPSHVYDLIDKTIRGVLERFEPDRSSQ